MCVKQDSFDRLVETVQEIRLTVNDVKNTGEKSHDQVIRINSRVDKLEKKYDYLDENIHTLKRYRAGRYVDCPNREDIDAMKNNMVSAKAVKKEMRFWFLGVLIPVIGLLLSILVFMNKIQRDEKDIRKQDISERTQNPVAMFPERGFYHPVWFPDGFRHGGVTLEK